MEDCHQCHCRQQLGSFIALFCMKIVLVLSSRVWESLLFSVPAASAHPWVDSCLWQTSGSQDLSLGSGPLVGKAVREEKEARALLDSKSYNYDQILIFFFFFLPKWHNGFEVRDAQKIHNLQIWTSWCAFPGIICPCVVSTSSKGLFSDWTSTLTEKQQRPSSYHGPNNVNSEDVNRHNGKSIPCPSRFWDGLTVCISLGDTPQVLKDLCVRWRMETKLRKPFQIHFLVSSCCLLGICTMLQCHYTGKTQMLIWSR